MNKVIVVGGGIAGLATAYELHKRHVPFVLLESASRAGGVILSETIDGFTIDAGPDSLLVQKREAVALCEELGLGDRLVPTLPPRLAFILRGGVLHPLPASSVLGIPTRIGPFVRTRLFSWAGKMRMGAEVFVPPRREDEDESIGGFMTRRFGREATEYLAEPLLAGIHSGDVDRLSIRALFPRFVDTERAHGSLLRAFRAQAALRAKSGAARASDSLEPSRGAKTPSDSAGGGAPARLDDRGAPRELEKVDSAFRSLPGGLSEMTRALVAALPERSIRLQTRVERVLAGQLQPSDPPAFRVDTSSGESLTASCVILAAPAFAAARIVKDLDVDLARLCNEIPYVSTATIALAFTRDAVAHPLNGSGFVVPKVEGAGILAASWLSSKWPHRAPEGRVLMRAFAGGARDPNALQLSDEALVTRAMDALAPLLGIAGSPLLTRVYRWERANAQHEVGHPARMAAIDRALASRPGLFVTGSGFRGVGIPDCVADGRATARQAAEWLARTTPAAAARA